ncbi:MAG: acetyl-CoA carboxylase, carboxyltransferase subunit beta [Fibrobacterales bacterium]
MEWFKRSKSGVATTEKRDTPTNLWLKCDDCKEVVYRKELEKTASVCPNCSYHFKISAMEYIDILIDEGTFFEMDENLEANDPLKFNAKKKYRDSLNNAMTKTGRKNGVVSGVGEMNGSKVAIGVMDFAFVGGSMGSVEGEKIARVFKKALELKTPAIILSASGGARMQEGALSLMQMAKTAAFLARMNEQKLPYVSVCTNPTTGGVTASYAMLGDINIAEPGALIGFAGARVIRETIMQNLPEGFQSAEFVEKKGFLDFITPRNEMKSRISLMLEYFGF